MSVKRTYNKVRITKALFFLWDLRSLSGVARWGDIFGMRNPLWRY